MDEESITAIESYVKILFEKEFSPEEKQLVDLRIRDWQHSENIFDQCFAILSQASSTSNLGSYLTFIAIKTLQEKIRYSFRFFTQDLIDHILKCFLTIINILTTSSSLKPISESIQIKFSLFSLCDLLTLTSVPFSSIFTLIPDSLKMPFVSFYFEEIHEDYWHQYFPSKQALPQNSFIIESLEILSQVPMTEEWITIFGAIVSLGYLEAAISLFPKLPDTLQSFDMASKLSYIFSDLFSSMNHVSQDMINAVIQFLINYSVELVKLASENSDYYIIIQNFWLSFFKLEAKIDKDVLIPPISFFFEISQLLQLDISLWSELLLSTSSMIKSYHLKPMIIPFFQLSVFIYNNYLTYISSHADEDIDLDGFDDVLLNLHHLSKKSLNEFLLEIEPKTPAVLKIAGLNCNSIDDQLLRSFAELALTITDNSPLITISLTFIKKSFKRLPNMIPQFYAYVLTFYQFWPQLASFTLFDISLTSPDVFLQLDSEIIPKLFQLLNLGSVPSKVALIKVILNLSMLLMDHSDVIQFIIQQLSLFFTQFSQSSKERKGTLRLYLSFISAICKDSHIANMEPLYNELSNVFIRSVEDICLNPDLDIQNWISQLFQSLIRSQWISDYSFVVQYAEHLIDSGLAQSFHLVNFISELPMECMPPKVIELCNSLIANVNARYVEFSSQRTFIKSISGIELNSSFVQKDDILLDLDDCDEVIYAVASILSKLDCAKRNSFQLLNLFSPLLFTGIILFCKSKNCCDIVYRAIENALALYEVDPSLSSHDILIGILRGCTMKVFRCQKDEEKFLKNPMLKLHNLIDHSEFLSQFFDALPFSHLIPNGGKNGDSIYGQTGYEIAMNYLAVINNSQSSYLDCMSIIETFTQYFTNIAEQYL